MWLDQLREAGRSAAVIARVRVALCEERTDPMMWAFDERRDGMLYVDFAEWTGPNRGGFVFHRDVWEAMAKRILTYVGEQREREGVR